MRQVPAVDATPFGIVGDGRVARHFRHYFRLLGVPSAAGRGARPVLPHRKRSHPVEQFCS